MSFQFFDRDAEYRVTWRRLPHWEQAGVVCFITWRTWDSMPISVLSEWIRARDDWLRRRDIDPRDENWKSRVRGLPKPLQDEFQSFITERWERHLDECHGACVLRRPELARIVADSLHHFDGERYELSDFVVMPNHVHVLVAFPGDDQMLGQCTGWKRYTATRINRELGRRGSFWQEDGFDHLVRSPEQFDYFRRYIADNPGRARLSEGEYVHYEAGPL